MLLLALVLAACSTPRYTMLEVGPLNKAEVWRGMTGVAASAQYPPGPGTDQGLLIFESRWRNTVLQDRHPGRRRLYMDAQPLSGFEHRWVVRYYVEQQKVRERGLLYARSEADWSSDGQNTLEEEEIARKLSRLAASAEQSGDRDPERR